MTGMLSFFAVNAAEPSVAKPQREPERNVISFRIPDAFFSSFFFNFERLVGDRHGLVVEVGKVGAYRLKINGTDWRTHDGYTLGAQYRFHFWKGLNSLFLGAFLKYGSVAGTIYQVSNAAVLFNSTIGQPQMGFTTSYLIIGLNVGHRFIWYPGIALTLRMGAGPVISNYKYSTEDFAANRDAFSKFFDNILRIDFEVSLGYAF